MTDCPVCPCSQIQVGEIKSYSEPSSYTLWAQLWPGKKHSCTYKVSGGRKNGQNSRNTLKVLAETQQKDECHARVALRPPLPRAGDSSWYCWAPSNNNRHEKISRAWTFHGNDRRRQWRLLIKKLVVWSTWPKLSGCTDLWMYCRAEPSSERRARTDYHSDRKNWPWLTKATYTLYSCERDLKGLPLAC